MCIVGMKQVRMDNGNMADQQLICLSPNGCCMAVGLQENVYFFDSGHLLTNSEFRDKAAIKQLTALLE